MSYDPRKSDTHKANAAALRALRLPCALCGGAIDYDAEPRTTNSFAADHIVPVSVNPDAALDPANLRPAHHGCNSGRGNRDSETVAPRRASRVW